MKTLELQPTGGLILACCVIRDKCVMTPGYVCYSRKYGLEIFPFEKELPSASYAEGTLFVLSAEADVKLLDGLDVPGIREMADNNGWWYKKTPRSDVRAGETLYAEPLLLLK